MAFPSSRHFAPARTNAEYRAMRLAIARYVEAALHRTVPPTRQRGVSRIDRIIDDLVSAIHEAPLAYHIAKNEAVVKTLAPGEWEAALQEWGLIRLNTQPGDVVAGRMLDEEAPDDGEAAGQ